jgi:hypothetical protein
LRESSWIHPHIHERAPMKRRDLSDVTAARGILADRDLLPLLATV